MSKYTVTKCICHDRSFEDIKRYTEANDITSVEELQEERYCSSSCRLCAPYVELVLQTGKTTFTPGAHYKTEKDTS